MENVQKVLALLQDWVVSLLTPAGAFQVAIVLVSAFAAWSINTLYARFVTARLGESEIKGFARATLRGSLRLVFPFSMLLLIIIGKVALAALDSPTELLDVIVPLLLSLGIVRAVVYVLRRSFTPSAALRAWEGIISTIIWLIVAIYLLGWLPALAETMDGFSINVGDARVSLLSAFKLLIMIAGFMILASWLSGVVESRMRKSPHVTKSMRIGIAKSLRLFLFVMAAMLALNAAGIDLTALHIFGGALGVGIGFGLQRIASNFISGFILLFDRSIKPGDVISVGDRLGWVKSLRARYIVVRDRDGIEFLIPNENLITSEVTNYSYSDRNTRVRLPIQVSYDDEPEHAMGLLEQAADGHPRVLKDPPPMARLTGFGDNGIDLELRLWIKDPEAGLGGVRSDVYLKIWKLFKEHNISIPFPQRDVRVIKE